MFLFTVRNQLIGKSSPYNRAIQENRLKNFWCLVRNYLIYFSRKTLARVFYFEKGKESTDKN